LRDRCWAFCHLGIGGVGHATPIDLDGPHAAVPRSQQCVALRGQFFEVDDEMARST